MPQISVFHLPPNSMYDSPLHSADKLLLLPARKLLTADDLAQLKKWQIDLVETTGKRLADAEVERILQESTAKKISTRTLYGKIQDLEKKRAFEFYLDSELQVRSMVETVGTGVHIEPEKIRGLMRRWIEEVRRARDIYLNIIHNDYSKEEHLFFHILNNTILCITIGVSMNLPEEELIQLGLGAFFADIGMLKVPKHLRDKTRELSEADITLIRKHPLESEKILNRWLQDYEESVIRTAIDHHENVDGSGYPAGKKSIEIHTFAKILALADVYNAMTKRRAYRKGKGGVSVMREMILMKDKKFDAAVLKTFLGVMSVFPVGTLVKLSDSTYGLVVKPNVGQPLRPVIKVLFDQQAQRIPEPILLDLRGEGGDSGIKIVGPVDPASLPKIDIVDEL